MKNSNSTIGKVGRPANFQLQQQRRNEILNSATKIFAKHGFAATDVQEIADLAGIGKGTVYRYFDTKESLFLATVDYGMHRLTRSVDSAREKQIDPLKLIADTIKAYLKFFDQNPEVIELLIHERAHFRDRKKSTYFVHSEANIGPWRQLCQNLIDQGVFREQSVDVLINVLSDLLYGTIFTNHFSGRKAKLVSQADGIVAVIFNGILANKKGPQRGKK